MSAASAGRKFQSSVSNETEPINILGMVPGRHFSITILFGFININSVSTDASVSCRLKISDGVIETIGTIALKVLAATNELR
jgi:hypothetical protein